MSDQEEQDSILNTIHQTRELWSTKADAGDISYLTPKSGTPTTPVRNTPVENGVNGHANGHIEIVRAEDQIEDEFELPDVQSIKSQWEKKPPKDNTKHAKKPPKHKTALDREKPAIVPVNRESVAEEKEEEYEVEMRKLKEHFEMEAKNSYKTQVPMRNQKVGKESINKRVSIFEEEIKIAQTCEVSSEKEDLPKVELSSLKHRFETNKDQKLITPETTGVPKRQTSQISIQSTPHQSNADIEVVRPDASSHVPPEEEIEVEVGSIRKRFEMKAKERTVVTSKPVEIDRAHKESESSETSSEPAQPAPNVVRSSEAVYDEMVGEESVKERLARYREMANKPTEIKHKISFKRKSTSPKQETKVQKPKPDSPKQNEEEPNFEIEVIRSPPAGTKETPDYEASVDLKEAKALFEERASPRRGSRHSSTGGSSIRSSSTTSPLRRSTNTSPSPTRGSKHSSKSPNRRSYSSQSPQRSNDVVVLESHEVNYYYEKENKNIKTKVKRLDSSSSSSDSDQENMEVIRPPPAGSKETADYSPSVDLKSVRSMFENPKPASNNNGPRKPRQPIKRPVIVEQNRSSSSSSPSPERNPNIVRSSTPGQKEELGYEIAPERLSAVKNMFSSPAPKTTTKTTVTRRVETIRDENNVEREIVRSSVAKEEPEYELSIDMKATKSMFESPRRPTSYEPRNTVSRSTSSKASTMSVSSETSDVVQTTEAGAKEVPEYKVDLKSKKQMFESGNAQRRSSSSSSSSEEEEDRVDVVRSTHAGKREVVDVKPASDINHVKQMFEKGDAKSRSSSESSESDHEEIVTQETKIVTEVKEEEVAASSSSSESETESEGEVELAPAPQQEEVITYEEDVTHEEIKEDSIHDSVESLEEKQEILEENQENLEDVVQEEDQKIETNSMSSSSSDEAEDALQVASQEEVVTYEEEKKESDEEPAAAVIPVRVAIPEPLQDDTEAENLNEVTERQAEERERAYSSSSSESEHQEEAANEQQQMSSESSEEKRASMSSASSDEETNYLN